MVGDDRHAHRRPAGSSTAPPIYCGPSRAAISNIRLRTHQSTPGRWPESTAGCGAAGFCCATKRGRMSYPRHSSSEPRIGALAQQRPRRSRQSGARAQRAPTSVGTRIRADSLPIREQCRVRDARQNAHAHDACRRTSTAMARRRTRMRKHRADVGRCLTSQPTFLRRTGRARHAIRSRHRARHAPGVTHNAARTTRILARTIGSDSNAQRPSSSMRFASFRVGERVGRPSRSTIDLANRCIDASLFRRTRATVRSMRARSDTRIARWSRTRCDATTTRSSHVVQLQCLQSRATNVCSGATRCDEASVRSRKANVHAGFETIVRFARTLRKPLRNSDGEVERAARA